MHAIGIVFLYDRNEGTPEIISKRFSKNFARISENLVKKDLLGLANLKEILDSKSIYWGGIKERFNDIMKDKNSIGQIAWQVFKSHTGKEAAEDIGSLIYEGPGTPWNFTIIICVLYE